MYPMTDEDPAIQARARGFVDDELIPHEVEAEMNGGRIDPEVRRRHYQLARDLGLHAMNMPRELGGGGMTVFQQALVSEQIGRVTNGLGWCVYTPPGWAPASSPTSSSSAGSCRASRETATSATRSPRTGSDVDAIAPTARRDGDGYVLDGVKMHVTSFIKADYCFFQAKLTEGEHAGEHALFFVDVDAPGVRVVRSRGTCTLRGRASDRRVRGRARSGVESRGPRAATMSFTHAWFSLRAPHDRRAMLRRGGQARRRGERLRAVSRAVRRADLRESGDPVHARRFAHGALGRPPDDLSDSQAVDEDVDVKVQHAYCSMAKLYASEMAGRVADRAVQIFGGRGYMRENVAERFYREVRVDRIWGGRARSSATSSPRSCSSAGSIRSSADPPAARPAGLGAVELKAEPRAATSMQTPHARGRDVRVVHQHLDGEAAMSARRRASAVPSARGTPWSPVRGETMSAICARHRLSRTSRSLAISLPRWARTQTDPQGPSSRRSNSGSRPGTESWMNRSSWLRASAMRLSSREVSR